MNSQEFKKRLQKIQNGAEALNYDIQGDVIEEDYIKVDTGAASRNE